MLFTWLDCQSRQALVWQQLWFSSCMPWLFNGSGTQSVSESLPPACYHCRHALEPVEQRYQQCQACGLINILPAYSQLAATAPVRTRQYR